MFGGNKRNESTLNLQTSVFKRRNNGLTSLKSIVRNWPLYLDNTLYLYLWIFLLEKRRDLTPTLVSVRGILSDYKILKEYVCERLLHYICPICSIFSPCHILHPYCLHVRCTKGHITNMPGTTCNMPKRPLESLIV